MTPSALRPRSVTEIVDAAFQILRAHYGQFVMCSALANLPWLVLELLFIGDAERVAGTSFWALGAAGVGVWLSFSLMSAVIVTCASQAYLGDAVDVSIAVRRALPRLPRVMLAALLKYVMLILGFFALIVGMLYVVARFFALTPVIILEDASVGTAFSRSGALSEGRKGHILNTIGLVAVIYWVIAIGIAVVGQMFGNPIVQAVVSAIFTVLAYPAIAITETLLYYDARIQGEGLDIELMASELGESPPPEAARP